MQCLALAKLTKLMMPITQSFLVEFMYAKYSMVKHIYLKLVLIGVVGMSIPRWTQGTCLSLQSSGEIS